MFQKWFQFSCISVTLLVTLSIKAESSTLKKHKRTVTQTQRTHSASLLKAIQTTYKNVKSLSGSFTQEQGSPLFADKVERSSGFLAFQAPFSFKWDTTSTPRSTLISNGETFWFYTPAAHETEKPQVIISKAKNQQSRLLTGIFVGNFSKELFQTIAEVNATTLILTPTPEVAIQAGNIKNITVSTRAKTKTIEKVIIQYKAGHQTTICLSSITFNPSLPQNTFEFTPTEDTQIIEH